MSDNGLPEFTTSGRQYFVDGGKVKSVTTYIVRGYPKDLKKWAAETTAAYAVNRWDELDELPVAQRLRDIEQAIWNTRDAASGKGTAIHGYGELLVTGKPVEVPDELAGHVNAYARFLDQWDVEPTIVERPVCNVTHRWGGRPDIRGILRGGVDWLLDLKTGRTLVESFALQLAAYAHAEFYLDDAGTVREWTRPERAGIVHISADSCELHEVDASDRTYGVFRHAAWVAEWHDETTQAWKDRRPWPVGPAIRPPAA